MIPGTTSRKTPKAKNAYQIRWYRCPTPFALGDGASDPCENNRGRIIRVCSPVPLAFRSSSASPGELQHKASAAVSLRKTL
jgi:hypothetical protein